MLRKHSILNEAAVPPPWYVQKSGMNGMSSIGDKSVNLPQVEAMEPEVDTAVPETDFHEAMKRYQKCLLDGSFSSNLTATSAKTTNQCNIFDLCAHGHELLICSEKSNVRREFGIRFYLTVFFFYVHKILICL